MIDLSKVRFTTINDQNDIMCAGIINGNNIPLIYIHRYSAAHILGLYGDNGSNCIKVYWDHMVDGYNKVCNLVEDPGFSTQENKPSSKSRPSQYELQLPEYIRKEVIYKMAFNLDNEVAKKYIDDIVDKVIPFFTQNASPEEIANVAIVGDINKVDKHFQYTYPTEFTISSTRKEVLDLLSNKVANLCNLLIKLSKSDQFEPNITSANVKAWIKLQLDNYLYNTYGMNLPYFCALSIAPNQPTHISEGMIDDVIYHNDLLYKLSSDFLNEYIINLDRQRLVYLNTSGTYGYKGFITIKHAWNYNYKPQSASYRIDLSGDLNTMHRIGSNYKSITVKEKDLLVNYINNIKLYSEYSLPNYDAIMESLGVEKISKPMIGCNSCIEEYDVPIISTPEFKIQFDINNSNVVFGDSPVEFITNSYPTPKCVLDRIDSSEESKINHNIQITDVIK